MCSATGQRTPDRRAHAARPYRATAHLAIFARIITDHEHAIKVARNHILRFNRHFNE